MNTGNAGMTGTIIMLAIIALIVVVGLAASLIAIALQSIKSVDGKCPHSPASWPETPVDVLQQRAEAPESSMDQSRGQVSLPEPSANSTETPVDVPRQRARLPRSPVRGRPPR